MKFASIDIGSNAVRLLFCDVSKTGKNKATFKKNSLIRVPIRLGEDVFTKGVISSQKASKLVKTMQAFKQLIDVYDVVAYKACATSAMREAKNGLQVIKKIKSKASIKVEIVSGELEAQLIYNNHVAEQLDSKKAYLYIDVGGGSTELTYFFKNKVVASRSFEIGTIRILKGKVTKKQWAEMFLWATANNKWNSPISIGSGGNINKLLGMAGKKKGEAIEYKKLLTLQKMLKSNTLKERIEKLGLNADRADVIVPACEIFTGIMKTVNSKKVVVPQVGLVDGIIHLLYEQNNKS